MPHIDVSLYPGRSPEVKKELAQKIVDFLSAELKLSAEAFSVSVTEIEKEKFAEEVVKKFDRKDMVIPPGSVK